MYSKNYNFDEKIREIVEEAINEYYRQRAEFLSECREFIDSKTGEIINKRGLINRVTKADLNEEELKDVEVYLHGFGVIIFAPEKIIKKFIAKIPRYSLTREPPPAYTNPLEGWIRHIVINKTYIEGKYPRKDRKKILAHELQHAKFGLLEPLFIKFMNREYLSDILLAYKILERYKEEQRSEEISSARRDLLKRLLEELRESVFDEVKTEIIAQMYGTLYHVKNIEELLYKIWDDLLGERRRLDFLNNARLLNIQIQELDEETRRKLLNDPDFLSFRETILNEEYYRKIVEESLSALGELISVGRYSPTEAVLILYDIPLKKWPAMVRLILKEKEGSKK
jgi:thermostable 8-oxoguanine DNA glycosylase